MSHLLIVNYLSVFLATVAAFAFGNIYYMALSKHWMSAHRFNKEAMQANFAKNPMRPMIITFFATFIMSMMLYGLLTHMPKFDMRNGVISGLLIWVGFVATTMAVGFAFTMKSLKAWVIDSGHWLIVLMLQGLILGWFGKA